MRVTQRTRLALASRRSRKALLSAGYEEVGEGGGRLWELHRGWRQNHIITDVTIAPDGKSLFIKTAPVCADLSEQD